MGGVNPYLYFLMAGMLSFGTMNTIVLKAQDRKDSDVWYDGKRLKYQHPFFQCSNMFMGEFCCLAVFSLMVWLNKRKDASYVSPMEQKAVAGGRSTDFNKLWFAIPAACDVCGSTLMFAGLTMAAASVYQMMRGTIVLVTSISGVLFLGRKYYRHHWTGVTFVVIGVATVGVASLTMAKSDDTKPVGIILLLVSQLFSGALYVTEEKLLNKYYIHPLNAVGIEGLCGCTYWLILIPIFSVIPVAAGNEMFPYGYLENPGRAMEQIFNSPLLLFYVLLMLLSIACFNYFGVSVTRTASSAARATIDSCRTICVWSVSMLLGWEHFIWLQLVGFVFLTVGMLMFNEVLVIKFWGYEKGTKEYLARMKTEGEVSLMKTGEENEKAERSESAEYEEVDQTQII